MLGITVDSFSEPELGARGGGGGGGGLVKKISYEEVLGLKSNPLPFYTPFLTEKVPVLYTIYWQMIHLLHT